MMMMMMMMMKSSFPLDYEEIEDVKTVKVKSIVRVRAILRRRMWMILLYLLLPCLYNAKEKVDQEKGKRQMSLFVIFSLIAKLPKNAPATPSVRLLLKLS